MDRENLIQNLLLETKAIEIKTDDSFFTWTSGIESPIYCDNRLLLSFPEVRAQVVQAFIEMIKEKEIKFDYVAGVATAGIPWASFIAHELNIPMIFVRQKAKDHGKKSQIEGKINKGARALVVEDLISTGKSSAAVIEAMKSEGIIVDDIISVFSYHLDIATETFKKLNVKAHPLTNLPYFFENSTLPIHLKEKLLRFWGELNQ